MLIDRSLSIEHNNNLNFDIDGDLNMFDNMGNLENNEDNKHVINNISNNNEEVFNKPTPPPIQPQPSLQQGSTPTSKSRRPTQARRKPVQRRSKTLDRSYF